jgi:hypothetical protein
MIGRAIVSLLITVSLWLWGCSAPLTLGTTPVTNAKYYHTNPRTDSEALPTPQFIVVDATIDQGRITAIRLRHNSTQNARQEQDVQLNSVRTGQSSARQNATGESDRVIDAINAAFKRAQILETNNHTSDAGIATGAGELRGQRSVAAMGHGTP